MKNQTVKQFIGLALLILMATCAKAQTYYIQCYVGNIPISHKQTVYVTSKYQTVHVNLSPPDTTNYFQFTLENDLSGIIPGSADPYLWSTWSYQGRYVIRGFHNGQQVYTLPFWIKQQQ